MSTRHPVPGHDLVRTEDTTTPLGYPVVHWYCECGRRSTLPMARQHVTRGHGTHARAAAKKARS